MPSKKQEHKYKDINISNKSYDVAGKLRDATVNFDQCVSNTINKGPWQMDVKLSA